MARLRLELDQRTFDALAAAAAAELRPIPWQAESILRRVLGTRLDESASEFPVGGGLALTSADRPSVGSSGSTEVE